MNKAEFVSDVASRAGLSQAQAEKAINAVIESIKDVMRKGDTLSLVGFGTFAVKHRGPRQGKNPQTGEVIEIAATNTVSFKPGKGLKDAVNE
ncbi:MAG: HU family DNA-binding protein [Gammaproteobacteria bacterium]